MKPYLFLTSCLLSAATLVNLPPDLVHASSPVQKVLSSEAQGLNDTLRTITVWAGAGANLNFIPTGEIIKKVWLDDPSQIVLDFDGSMCTQSGERGEDNCSNSAATVVHLRRIHAIKFPDLPQTASTLLSVITQAPGGERKLYQFRIAYGLGKPQYHTVAIYPDSQIPNNGTNGLLQAQLQNVELGLRVAKSRNLLGRSQGNQRLELRVQNFLGLVSSGVTPQSAAQQAGVSLRLISKLASLATTSVQVQQQTQSPAPNQNRKPAETSVTTQPRVGQRVRTDKPAQLVNAPTPKQPSISSSASTSVPNQQKETSPVRTGVRTVENSRVTNNSPSVKKTRQTPANSPRRTPKRSLIAAKSILTPASNRSQQAIDDANATAFGLVVARQKGQIAPNTTTWKKAQGAIRQLRLGKNREEAARRSGIDMSVLNQLIEWGQTRP